MESLLASPGWPFVVLLIGIAAIVFMITVLRFHPFVALMIAAIVVGLSATDIPLNEGQNPIVAAVELPMVEFGVTAGKIAWVIVLAAVIGAAMMESGAAERIVQALLSAFGERYASFALLFSGFILAIPVFFDTVFFLLIPIAIALGQKTENRYVLYVLTMGGAASITHSLVPPTPGPLIMAETLQLDLGIAILGGAAFAILPALATIWIGKWLNNRYDVPMRITLDTGSSADFSNKQLPGLFPSLLPVLIPLILISMASIVKVTTGSIPTWMAFWGNKNIAMGIGTALALWLWTQQRSLSRNNLWKSVELPLQIAGVIILITSAGGAFGAMIKHSGIGEAIKWATQDFSVSYIVLAWLIAALMKTAQGSGTVAMITASSILVALVGDGASLPYHPLYLFVAMGFGSQFIVWMNDSGFWVVAKMGGFTEKEGLQLWSTMIAIIALLGLIQVLIFSTILPLR